MPSFYVNKLVLELEFVFNGPAGHASVLLPDTAAEKLYYVVGKFMEFRKNEFNKWKNESYPLGNITTINLTVLKGGSAENVIPGNLSATFDLRIAPNVDVDALEQQVSTNDSTYCKFILLKFK